MNDHGKMHLKEVEAKGYYIDLWESLKVCAIYQLNHWFYFYNLIVRVCYQILLLEKRSLEKVMSVQMVACAISVMGTLLRNIQSFEHIQMVYSFYCIMMTLKFVILSEPVLEFTSLVRIALHVGLYLFIMTCRCVLLYIYIGKHKTSVSIIAPSYSTTWSG